MGEVRSGKRGSCSPGACLLHPLCLCERGVSCFGFKIRQGYGCSSYHGVSSTLGCNHLVAFPIFFYVAVPFEIHSVFICVMLHWDSSCNVLGEDYLIKFYHFTHMLAMRCVTTILAVSMKTETYWGIDSAMQVKMCFQISVWFNDLQSQSVTCCTRNTRIFFSQQYTQ